VAVDVEPCGIVISELVLGGIQMLETIYFSTSVDVRPLSVVRIVHSSNGVDC